MKIDDFTPLGKKILVIIFWSIVVVGLIITKDVNV